VQSRYRAVELAYLALACLTLAACAASAPPVPALVIPAPPPRDDGRPSEGGEGGLLHAAALEQLKVSPLGWRLDRQNSIRVLLPDAARWLRVTFWGVPSLAAFRYGKDHHAIVGAFVVHVADETSPGACSHAFESSAQPWADTFDVAVQHDPPQAIAWGGRIVDIDSLVATTATLGIHEQYAAAYGAYPAWRGACLVLGMAVPARRELARAKAVRDRFVAEVLPRLEVSARDEPKERY
jgi:hypothetical protein